MIKLNIVIDKIATINIYHYHTDFNFKNKNQYFSVYCWKMLFFIEKLVSSESSKYYFLQLFLKLELDFTVISFSTYVIRYIFWLKKTMNNLNPNPQTHLKTNFFPYWYFKEVIFLNSHLIFHLLEWTIKNLSKMAKYTND